MRIRMTPAFNKKNIALLLVLLFVLIVAAVYPYAPSEISASDDPGLMRIVEVMTANTSLFVNSDGKICDYVKLENMGDAPVNLLGWGLSDHFNKAKYTFSECILQPGESVFVFLDRQWAGQRYLERYASFSLSSSGESVILFRPNGECADVVEVPAMNDNEVYVLSDGEWTISKYSSYVRDYQWGEHL